MWSTALPAVGLGRDRHHGKGRPPFSLSLRLYLCYCCLSLFVIIISTPVCDSSAFLEDTLPLDVLSVLPAPFQSGVGSDEEEEGAKNQVSWTEIRGRTALTVLFSRPVIALGSDFHFTSSSSSSSSSTSSASSSSLHISLTPFFLVNCGDSDYNGPPGGFAVPGKLRWITTFSARFDADIPWPSDLCFDLIINPSLRTYDNVSLLQPSLPEEADGQSSSSSSSSSSSLSWRFKTPSVHLSLSFVRSDEAAALTDGRWSSSPSHHHHHRYSHSSQNWGTGLSGGGGGNGEEEEDDVSQAHECPPDAIVYLSFSSLINHTIAYETLHQANPLIVPPLPISSSSSSSSSAS